MLPMPSLEIRPKAGLPLQASKWLKSPILIDGNEMQSLLTALGDFWIFRTSGVTRQGEGLISTEEFLFHYTEYVEALRQGKQVDEERIRPYFSAIFTLTPRAVYAVYLPNQQQLIKVDQPVIQLQHHKFTYSTLDGKFRSMVLGSNSISWGVQFSYPQLYQDANFQVKQVRVGEAFPNTALFHKLQKWVRYHTVATPFLIGPQRINVPIRLGKQCFEWINAHPQLVIKSLQIESSS